MPCAPAARLTVKFDATACRTPLSGFDGRDDGNETGKDGRVGVPLAELFDELPPQAASTAAAATTPTTNALQDRIAPPSVGQTVANRRVGCGRGSLSALPAPRQPPR